MIALFFMVKGKDKTLSDQLASIVLLKSHKALTRDSHFEDLCHFGHQPVLTHFPPFQEFIVISSSLDPLSLEEGHKLCWE